ncbi:MAG: hypothetical protein KDA97_05160 [Acidimicrobiales bacterium]|nr:hypothetical protein [Acidimicrobiales bacterium]
MKQLIRFHTRSARRADRRRPRRMDPSIAAELRAIVDRRGSVAADMARRP